MSLTGRVCSMYIVRMGYNAGQKVRELARISGYSESTIRRWLKTTGVHFNRRG